MPKSEIKATTLVFKMPKIECKFYEIDPWLKLTLLSPSKYIDRVWLKHPHKNFK